MDDFEFGENVRRLGERKVVFREGEEKRIRTIVGQVFQDGDFFIVGTGMPDDLWLHKDAVIAIKAVVR